MTLPLLKPSYVQKDELLRRYDIYLVAGRKSPDTRRIYNAALGRWFGYFDDPLLPSKTSLYNWLRARREAVSVATLNSELTAVRTFYRWAHIMEYTATDLSDMLPRSQRAPKRLVRYLDEDQVSALLAQPDLTTFIGYRDHVMMRLAYETGIRASEMVQLELGDILDDRMLFIRAGKGGHDRYVPFSEEMQGLLESWYRVRRTSRPGKSLTLFVTHRGKGFSKGRAVWEIVDRYARAALGVGRGYERIQATRKRKPWQGQYPHLFRAAMATHLLKSGADLRAIQELLGHKSLSTTALYLGVDLDMLRAAIQKHPRNSKDSQSDP